MKLKLLFAPRFEYDYNRNEVVRSPIFPPLGIAILTSFLRGHNFYADQDDLSIKIDYYNQATKDSKKINLSLFNEEKRIKNFLEEKHDPKLEEEAEKILGLTKCQGFDIFGFSSLPDENISVMGIIAVLAKLIKEKFGSTIIINSQMGEKDTRNKLFKSELIDYEILSSRIYSTAEVSLLEFCEFFDRGKDLKSVRGIRYYEDKEIKETNPRYKNKERCIFTRPDFDGLPLKLYKRRLEIPNEELSSEIFFLPYFFIRGCPNKCAFCMYSLEPLVAFNTPEKVVEDLIILSKKYKTRFFYFLNAEINPTYRFAKDIAGEIIKNDLNIFWTDCATFNNMDRKLLELLKNAGAARLVFGLESASPRMLSYLHKSFTLEKVEKVIKETHRQKILVQLDIIIGFPYENEKDVDHTITFLKKNRKYITDLNLSKFYLDGELLEFPETYDIQILKNKKGYKDWTSHPFDEVKGLKWPERFKLTQKCFENYEEFERKYLRRTLNPHEMFFIVSEVNLKRSFFSSRKLPEIKIFAT
jgi:pyruvate-formate lyase-activating enzyme